MVQSDASSDDSTHALSNENECQTSSAVSFDSPGGSKPRLSAEEVSRESRTRGDPVGKIKYTLQLGAEADSASVIPESSGACIGQDDGRKRVGRYQIRQLIAGGAFSRVYCAYDGELDRVVALKLQRAEYFTPEHIEAFQTESRILAALEHSNIVPVFDAGQLDSGPRFIVSKLIEGTSLRDLLKKKRLGFNETAQILTTIAEALHYAHLQGLVHRDIKPANILINHEGQAFVADFGMALTPESFGNEAAPQGGTVAYMSPEQARREGHRIDGRSDIFSLGVVLYEMTTGQRPFTGTQEEVLDQIKSTEACPPRQLNSAIPEELERICLHALAKRASDRYTTAQEMAEDLQHFLNEPRSDRQPDSSVFHAHTTIMSVPDTFVPRIVPKSVRPFEEEDADGFLQLLPGPRDRQGLPNCIRFWKNRIEKKEADKTFEVAVIYGPSGCGKTSLVKAGLLPRLDRHVAAVYLEATPESTESRLLSCLRRCCSTMPADIGLDGALVALRQGDHLPVGKTKILIVLDQFEQWLHGRTSTDHRLLLRALRQCDGRRVQCVLLVRDDFWLAIARFMRELELPIVEGQNSLLVDLFNPEHAKKVLTAFGCAFGRLPQDRRELSREQSAFINRAVSELAQDGKIVCVRLALFAEMLKDQPWTRATLRQLGGMEGVGVSFLEATLGAQASPPHRRMHETAAQAVLRALLPDEGQDMKCAMRPYGKLVEASGYATRSEAFTELLRILESELRLITPVDSEGKQFEEGDFPTADPTQRYYQLTHDFLVPALREWLTRRQKETRCGRAELCLSDCARHWHSKPTRRHLPAWYEFAKIRLGTKKRRWTTIEREMMRRAGWVYGIRLGLILLLLLVALCIAIAVQRTVEQNRRVTRAEALVTGLLKADTRQVPEFISEIDTQLRWALPRLQTEYREAAHGTPEKLHAGLALLSVVPSKLEYLSEQLLVVPPKQFLVVRDILRPHAPELRASLWETALDGRELRQKRFQAAAALALYDTDGRPWDEINRFVADYMVRVLPSHLGPWRDALQPVSQQLIIPLEVIFRDVGQTEHVRFVAADTLGAYAEGPKLLIELLAGAEEFQFSPIFLAIIPHKDRAIEAGRTIISESLPAGTSEPEKEHFARRQANLAIALMRLGETEPLWSLLRHGSDPRARSNLVHWIGPRGGDLSTIVSQFRTEENASIRRALVLSLGAFEMSTFDESAKQCLVEELNTIYETESDAGLRASAEWLLKKWGDAAHLAAVDQRLQAAEQPPTPMRAENPHRWYVTRQGHTMVVLSAGKVRMGSPHTEPFRDIDEAIHERRVERQFAIAAKEVTRAQFGRFRPELSDIEKRAGDKYSKTADSPQNFVTWYEAAAYSNWLSEQEGIPETQWCYAPNADGQFAEGMVTKENFLERIGYRLPTEAEWEFACRAGAQTSRYYGHSPSLLPEYAWYEANSEYRSWPVASLKPNDYGLFDMLGNVYEWCHGRYDQHPRDADDVLLAEATDGIFDTHERALRGGGFRYWGHGIRSAYRGRGAPDFRYSNFGFRVARTEPTPQLESE